MAEKHTELLPCPFCGSVNVDPLGWASKESAGPACDDCGASAGGINGTPEQNVAAWNRRPTLIAQAPAMLAMLQAIRKHGDLTNIDVGDPFSNHGGKKRPTMDAFYFPRHMLTELEAVIAAATGEAP